MTFLILRTRTADTLNQLDSLRTASALLGLQPDDVRCPTCRAMRRVGRSRERIEADVPVLGNFLFVRWDESLYFANYIEHQFPFISIMRLPHGGYATCSEKEIEAIGKLPPLPEPDPEKPTPRFSIGSIVQVIPGTFLQGISGKVLRCKSSGEVVLKVTNNRGWKINTLLIHGSLLVDMHASP